MVEPLIRVLNDPEARVRDETAAALCALGDRRSVEPLIAILGDPSAQ